MHTRHSIACGARTVKHERTIKALDFAAEHLIPLDTAWWTLAQCLKCGKCGSRRVGIMVASRELGTR